MPTEIAEKRVEIVNTSVLEKKGNARSPLLKIWKYRVTSFSYKVVRWTILLRGLKAKTQWPWCGGCFKHP